MQVQNSSERTLRTLILQNNREEAQLCVAALQKSGFSIRTDIALSRDEFESRLRLFPYDAVLSAYSLRDWSGLDALAALRNSGSDAAFLLVSAPLENELVVDCVKQGVCDFVSIGHLARLPVALERAFAEKALLRKDSTARKQAEAKLASVARCEAALASLSRHAVHDTSLGSLFADTAREAAGAFQIDLAGIFEWNPAKGLLLLRSGVGWNPSLSGVATINDSQRFQPGFALSSKRSAICEDFERETRFDAPPLFATHAIRSSVAILIPGATHPFGILCVCSRAPREFSDTELKFLASVSQLLSAVIRRAHSEGELSSSESRYRELIQNTPVGAFCGNISGKFIEVNPALVRMLGYSSAEELIAQPLEAVYENIHNVDLLLSQYAESGIVSGVEIPWKRKDGSRLTVRLTGRVVPDGAGNPLSLEIIVQDVTQRRELERQLHQSQKFEALGQLAGRMAHDFNNVIGAIIGWAELGAEQSADHARLHEYFIKIAEQANRASGLTRQLLAIARRNSTSLREIQLNKIVSEALPLVTSILGANIELETRFGNLTGTVRADSAQIEQVLMNLCVNARDAMPRGGRLILETKSSFAPQDLELLGLPAGCYAQLIVSDAGIGMDAATRERVFDPFFTTKEPGKGNGLGLTTVFGVVTQHEGYVRVESEPGRGSTFRILLPSFCESEAQNIHYLSQRASRPRNETILIAEDHEGVREVARVTLERCGYSVLLAGDGLNALEHFRRNPSIALVVMDLVMPRMGGHAAVAQMRDAKPDLPVIFTTGYAAEAVSIPGAVAGRDVILQKPYESSVLVRHVRDLLDRSRFHEALDTIAGSVIFRHSEG